MPSERSGPDAVSAWSSAPASEAPAQTVTGLSRASLPRPFGADLEPVLQQCTDHHLHDIHWFRTDWQRGGALTGYAKWRNGAATAQDVVIKLPVPPVERRWLKRLQAAEHVAPRLYAHGDELKGYDLAWVVMERLDHGPLGPKWDGREFDLLVEAAGRFYAAAGSHPVEGDPEQKNWSAILQNSRDNVHQHALPEEQRWKEALKKAHRKLDGWLAVWNDRTIDQWCHGDLHLGNAMTREPAPAGPAVLFDYACVHPGHWLEDAVYLEHLYWARRQKLGGRKLCSLIARERKKHGLPVEPDWPELAQVKRALLALSTPAMLEHDGEVHHVHAALEVLEAAVK